MSYMVENVTVEFAEDSFEKGQISDFYFNNFSSMKVTGNTFFGTLNKALENVGIYFDFSKVNYFYSVSKNGIVKIQYEGNENFEEATDFELFHWKHGNIKLYTILLTFKVSKVDIHELSEKD